MIKHNIIKVTIFHIVKGLLNVNAKDVPKYLKLDGFFASEREAGEFQKAEKAKDKKAKTEKAKIAKK